MSIDDILYEKAFIVNENVVVSLEIRVGPMTNKAMFLVDTTMVYRITPIIWFYILGGNIPLVTIVKVGVAWAPDPDTDEVSSIMAWWGGILLVRSYLEGGTCTNGNGKFPGNGGLKCGVNSSTLISSMITSFGSETLTLRGFMSTILV
jgi:hypothetical protein